MSIRVYRLLRNNKEEGPYTAEELIQKNLRPFDLIWVDGSSAAWRYPGELPQFKKYAPLPGDKEETETIQAGRNHASVSPSVQAAIAVNNNLAAAGVTAKPRYKVSAAWSRIQTLTSAATNVIQPENEKKITPKKSMVVSQLTEEPSRSLSWEEAWLDWEKEKQTVNDLPQKNMPVFKRKKTVKNSEPVLETKYAEPLDSLKDKYIENILQQQRRSKKINAGKASEFILPALALIIIFSVAYWLLNKTDAPAIKKSISTQQQSITKAQQESSPVHTEKENVVQPLSTSGNEVSAAINNQADNEVGERKKIVTPVLKTQENLQNDNAVKTSSVKQIVPPVEAPSSKQNTQNIVDNIAVAQKTIEELKTNSGVDKSTSADKKQVANTASTDTYKPTFLPGNSVENNEPAVSKENKKTAADYVKVPAVITMTDGIANIKIENVSDVNLDLIVVDVQYFNSTNNFRKGETFYLHNLKAGKNVVIKTPKDITSAYATSKVSLISSDTKQVYVVGDN